MSKPDAKDVVILLLDALDENPEPNGMTRLQKLTCLLSNEDELEYLQEKLGFTQELYGPFSTCLTDEIRLLDDAGFIEANKIDIDKHSKNRRDEIVEETMLPIDDYMPPHDYRITSKGKDLANILKKKLLTDIINCIENVSNEVGTLPLDDLLKHVYDNCKVKTRRVKV